MKIAFIIFDGITWLDLVGIYDPITRLRSQGYLPGLHWEFCSLTSAATDNFGFSALPTLVNPSLETFDAIVVPGGSGTRALMHDQPFIDFLLTGGNAKYKISICTGSLLLGAAGWLKGKTATTHFSSYEILEPLCGAVSRERIVEDGNVITAGAVAASLDLGLFLCDKWSGPEARKSIARSMNYQGAEG